MAGQPGSAKGRKVAILVEAGVYVPGGQSAATLKQRGDAHVLIAQLYKHGKAIAATGEGMDLLTDSLPEGAALNQMGVVSEREGAQHSAAIQKFIAAIPPRHWGRPSLERVSACPEICRVLPDPLQA